MKSNAKPIRTMMTTYATDSGILEGDALQHVADALTLIQRALERVVHLLPLHDLERVRLPAEQLSNGLLVDRVAFLLEPLDRAAALRNDGGFLDRRYAGFDVRRGTRDGLRQSARRLTRLGNVEHRHAARGAIEQIDDVVELRGEDVDVLTVDRGDETPVDARADVMREDVRFVLDGFDRGDIVIELVRLGEQAIQEASSFLQPLG